MLLADLGAALTAAPPDRGPVPERPWLKPWLRRKELPGRVLVEHGRRTVSFGGAAAGLLLPVLLPLLDGRRTVAEIVEAVGPAVEPAVRNALELLARHGLLTDGPPLAGGDPLAATALAFAPRAAEAPEALRRRLAGARVVVEGDPGLGGAIAAHLRTAGIEPADGADPADLVVTAGPAADDPVHARRNELALVGGGPWLPVGCFDGASALVGPLVVPGETACHACAVVRRRAASGCGAELAELADRPGASSLPPGLLALVAAVAADRALRWLATRDPLLPGVATVLASEPQLALECVPVLRVPRCPACSGRAAAPLPSPWHEAAA